ncbi:MAG: FixH family protein, partial [Acidimicrobiia bacterium]
IPFIPTGDTGGDEGPTSADLLQPGNTATESSRLRYLTDGDPAGLANGGLIDLPDGSRLQVFVSPFPPTEFSTDIEFLLTSEAGDPITDAVIEAEWDMIMVHGPFQSTFRHTAAGRYQTDTFDFFMFGPWQLAMTIDRPAGSTSVKLAVYVWPD